LTTLNYFLQHELLVYIELTPALFIAYVVQYVETLIS